MNVVSVNYHPGGPSCTYKGKTVFCLVKFSEGRGISGHILTNILRHLDDLKSYENDREKKLFLRCSLVDVSCFDLGFLKYICDENHKLTVFPCSVWSIIVSCRRLNKTERNIQNSSC